MGHDKLHATEHTDGTDDIQSATNAQKGLATAQQIANLEALLQGTYAEIYAHDASTAQSIPTGATKTKVDAFTTDGNSRNCTPAAASDKITITKVGRYRVACKMSFESATASLRWKGAIFLNGVEQPNLAFTEDKANINEDGDVEINGIMGVTSQPVDVDVRVSHDDAGSVNMTVVDANLNVQLIGNNPA